MENTSVPYFGLTEEAVVIASQVGHRFGAAQVLQSVDLEAEPGEWVGLVGPNGAGKSTLLRILCGQLQPTSGSVAWGGLERGTAAFRAAVVLATQRPQLDPEMTGRETLDLFRALGGTAVPIALLGDALDERVRQYSGGMKRRLHLMIASLTRPRLLALDEPGAGLDSEGRQILWRWIRERCEDGATVLVASHNLPDCDRIVELGR